MSGTIIEWENNRIFYSPKSHPNFQALIKHFEAVLDSLHSERKKRPNVWFKFEMEGLLDAINWERAQRDKDPIPMRLLLRRETGASGHTDYAHKLALYAAEMVLDQDNGP